MRLSSFEQSANTCWIFNSAPVKEESYRDQKLNWDFMSSQDWEKENI